MTEDQPTLSKLRRVSTQLTGDADLQKDLLQEMLLHLVRVKVELPGHTSSWYVMSCRFRARNYLRQGRSVDSFKRQNNLVSLSQCDDDSDFRPDWVAVDSVDLRSELITRDIVDQLVPRLTDTQQRIFFLLLHGFGVCEIALELRVSHPAVVRHRKKIAGSAAALLADAGCVCSSR